MLLFTVHATLCAGLAAGNYRANKRNMGLDMVELRAPPLHHEVSELSERLIQQNWDAHILRALPLGRWCRGTWFLGPFFSLGGKIYNRWVGWKGLLEAIRGQSKQLANNREMEPGREMTFSVLRICSLVIVQQIPAIINYYKKQFPHYTNISKCFLSTEQHCLQFPINKKGHYLWTGFCFPCHLTPYAILHIFPCNSAVIL